MRGASSHVSLTPSPSIGRRPLRPYRNGVPIFSSSCRSFVTHSPLSWSHDARIHGTRRIEEEP